MMKISTFCVSFILALLSISQVSAQETDNTLNYKKFNLKPYVGLIGIQDMSLQLADANETTNISVETNVGFTAGISLGYLVSTNISAEIGWEYKSNDITVINNSNRSSGDYASNFIYVNGKYHFFTNRKIMPYIGLGASLIQEIDLDFGNDLNASFSDSGNIGFQGLAGLDLNLSNRWALNWEVKYVTFSDFDMENEANNDQLNNLKYNPFISNIGIKYRF